MNESTRRLIRLRWLWLAAVVLLGVVPGRAQSAQYTLLSQGTIQSRLGQVTRKNADREAALKRLFHESGCQEPQLSEQPVKHASLPNVLCVLPGKSEQVILVGAHFDHVEVGEGAVDNWSGAALLASLYQSLRDQPRQHTFVFLGFTDEEKGLVGSTFYVHNLSAEDKGRIVAMVDMDSLGLGPTKVWTSHSDAPLLTGLLRVAQATKLPVAGVNVEQAGTSDAEPFAASHIPRTTVHSVTQETWHILHSKDDTLSAIRQSDYYDSYHLLAGYLAYLDVALPPSAPATAPAASH